MFLLKKTNKIKLIDLINCKNDIISLKKNKIELNKLDVILKTILFYEDYYKKSEEDIIKKFNLKYEKYNPKVDFLGNYLKDMEKVKNEVIIIKSSLNKKKFNISERKFNKLKYFFK